jgi:hypothetical protein
MISYNPNQQRFTSDYVHVANTQKPHKKGKLLFGFVWAFLYLRPKSHLSCWVWSPVCTPLLCSRYRLSSALGAGSQRLWYPPWRDGCRGETRTSCRPNITFASSCKCEVRGELTGTVCGCWWSHWLSFLGRGSCKLVSCCCYCILLSEPGGQVPTTGLLPFCSFHAPTAILLKLWVGTLKREGCPLACWLCHPPA